MMTRVHDDILMLVVQSRAYPAIPSHALILCLCLQLYSSQWEHKTGKRYYDLSPSSREAANKEIGDTKVADAS